MTGDETIWNGETIQMLSPDPSRQLITVDESRRVFPNPDMFRLNDEGLPEIVGPPDAIWDDQGRRCLMAPTGLVLGVHLVWPCDDHEGEVTWISLSAN